MSDIEKIEYRAVIKFLYLEKESATNIAQRLRVVYGDKAPAYSTVAKWVAEFKRGRLSVEDDPRCGAPSVATSEEMCQKVEVIVMRDRRFKISEIATEVGISYGSVFNILHDKLGMSKVCARWVPRMLTPVQKVTRAEVSKELLDEYERDPVDFVSRLVTGDETWIHHWDPQTKQESMQWKHSDSPPPKKFRTQASAGKVMATVFWDSQGLILIDYLPHNSTITGVYYAELLSRLRDAIKNKRRGKLTHGPLLLHDNAPVHTSQIAQAALRDCGYQQLPHPPYSPDLAPSDFFLFRHLKKALRGKKISNDDELKEATEAWFGGLSENFFAAGVNELPQRWQKCIDVMGDYIEK